MIRREMGGKFWLFTQHEHALLAGELAKHVGNDGFAPPAPREEVVEAVKLHDCGWPVHDDRPTLKSDGLPLDVFESNLELGARVWNESVDRVAGAGVAAYTQLLVSLHVLGLSGFIAGDTKSRQEIFQLNKFQQRQIEVQERLRPMVGLRTDIPLRLGLAEGQGPMEEEQLRRNYMILQLMDRISLGLLCTKVVFPKVENVMDRVGGAPLTVSLSRVGEWGMKVAPWVFDVGRMKFPISCRVVEGRRFRSVEEFRGAYERGERREVIVELSAG